MTNQNKKAYVVAVDMGYGHQRAAYPLLHIATTPTEWGIAEPMIISANSYPNMAKQDKEHWDQTRKTYEWFSRMNELPFIGKVIFFILDFFQQIDPFYPRRDLSRPSAQILKNYRAIRKGFGKHLIDTLNKEPLPLIATFFVPAFFAEEHGYKGEIYCLCTDTDVSRAWAPLNPKTSRIIYLAPTRRVKERLELYGVRPEKIITTGFPLPEENIGSNSSQDILKAAVARRIAKLDPRGVYQKKYKELLALHFGDLQIPPQADTPLNITFAVGGAGAQWAIGLQVLESLREQVISGSVKINLIAGSSTKILKIFEHTLQKMDLGVYRNKTINIVFNPNKFQYFREFDKVLNETDILWTKPSELSFYAGLGLPIIMAPTLGSQETRNKSWLHMIGAGFEQDNPAYTNEWLFDWLQSGWLANAAMNGYLNAPKRGAYHIEDVVLRDSKTEIEDIHFL